jgi:fructosamine-3-kinase
MSPNLLDSVQAAVNQRIDAVPVPVGGGCIHRAFRLGSLFVKVNHASCIAMFEAEAEGLRALAATRTVRVPEPVATGCTDGAAFLALEWLDLHSGGDEALLGEQLAALHETTSPTFGWHRDNTIGATPQPNPPTADWLTFFREHRLGHLFCLLEKQGYVIPGARDLLDGIERFFPAGPPVPALLHGDLWGGNAAYLTDKTPVLFDPACWFGDPEADIAMTLLFGGFNRRFHEAYRSASGRVTGHPRLHELHQLYHLLNHALLFGGSYLAQSRQLTGALARA